MLLQNKPQGRKANKKSIAMDTFIWRTWKNEAAALCMSLLLALMQVPLQNRLKCFTPSWYLGSSHFLARPQVSLSVCGLFGVKKGYKILPLAQLHRRITRKGEFLLLSKIAYKVKIVSNSGNIYSPGSSPNKSVHSDWLQNIAAVK